MEWEVLLCRTYALIVTGSRLRTAFGGSPQGMVRNSALGGVRLAAASAIGGLQTGFLVNPREHGPLTNQQKDGDSFVENIVTGLLENSSQGVMNGLRKFIEVDHHEAVKVGGLSQNIISIHVVPCPRFFTRHRGRHQKCRAVALMLGTAPLGDWHKAAFS